jgi:hypothetical protein
MTASDLRDLFLTTLVKRFGGNGRRWRMAMGEVRVYSRDTHPHCNWAVHPSGSARENEAIEAVADDLRSERPIVDA